MKHTSRKKNTNRRYKRIVAALAGAAVVSSAMLPGLPFFKVQAAENMTVSTPSPDTAASPLAETAENNNQSANDATRETARNHDRDKGSPAYGQSISPTAAVKSVAGAYGFDARHDSFSLQWHSTSEAMVMVHTARDKTFKVRLRMTEGGWKITSVTEVITGGHGDGGMNSGDPVGVVKENASSFGFDAYNDSFTLLSIASGKAIVQVKTNLQSFKVDLERNNGNWIITTIRGIGNSKYPATYRPASFFGYQAAAAPAVIADKQTLYSTDAFADWSWHQSAYPADMKIGVLLAKPESAEIADLPGIIVDKVASIDFNRQFALYVHIGYVDSTGFGIGIEKVVQTGNDLIVTLRMKSPLENHTLLPTVTNDVIPIDRLTFDFDNPIHIKFVNQNGTDLSNYTLYKR